MILVTGGTGLVGSHLLLELTRNDHRVRAIYRDPKSLDRVLDLFSLYTEHADSLMRKIDWMEADLNNLPVLERAFEGIRLVFHSAALISFDPNDFNKLVAVNEVGTSNIVNLCIAHGVSKLCYVSSIAALGKNPGQKWVDEETEWRNANVNPYALTKHLAEMEVWRGTQEGVPAVIVNPGVIIGPGFWGSGSGKLFRTAARGPKFFPPGGTGITTVEDVVRLMLLLMDSEVENERFIVVNENWSYRELLGNLTRNLNRKPPTNKIPLWVLKVLWRIDWLAHLLTGKKRRLSKAQVQSMTSRTFYSNEKAKMLLEFEYSSLEDAIRFSCEKFREQNPSLVS